MSDFNRSNTTISFPGSQISPINTGIVNGSLSVREILCSDRLAFGDINSNEFQCQLYNCPDLTGKKIQVTQTVTDEVNGQITTSTVYIFTGWVSSCKTDDLTGFKNIVAYDYFYKARKKKIKAWWDSFWTASRTSAKLGVMWRNLLSYYSIPYTDKVLILDEIQIKKNKKLRVKTFTNFISQLCELNMCVPNISRTGNLEFISLYDKDTANATDIRGEYTISQSQFEDYTIEPYNKVELYDEKGKLKGSAGSGKNVLVIQNNILLFKKGATSVDNIAGYILEAMHDFNIYPANITMKVSNLDLHLGDLVRTQKGYCLICENNYSGSLLVDQSVVSNEEEELSSGAYVGSNDTKETVLGNTDVRIEDRMDFQLDELGDFTNTHLEKMDDGTIVIRDENLAGDEDSGATRAVKFWVWSYNTGAWGRVVYTIYDIYIECTNYNFIIADHVTPAPGGSAPRVANIGGKNYVESKVWLVVRTPYGAPRPIWRELNTYHSGNDEEKSRQIGTAFHVPYANYTDWREWVHESDGTRIGDYVYYRKQWAVGTLTYNGMYGMSRPDKHYPSEDAFLAAFNAGEINPPELKNGDVVLPSATTQQQTIDNLVGLANEITGENNSGSDTSTENQDSIPTSGTPTNVASNSKQEIIANTINTIKNGISSWIGNIVNSGRGNVVATVTKRDGTTATQILASTNIITNGAETPQTGAEANDLHCYIGDSSGIGVAKQSQDQYTVGDLTVGNTGYSGRASSYTGNESGNTEYGGKFALAISGLTVGEQYTFSYKLSAFAFGEAEYSDVEYRYMQISGSNQRYGHHGVLYTDTFSYDESNLPDTGSANQWDSTLKWQNFPDLTRTDTSFSNTITATATTMYMVFYLEPIKKYEYPKTVNFVFSELKEANMVIKFSRLFVYGDDNLWHEFDKGSEGTINYELLENKPTVNNVQLLGNKTTRDLGIIEEITQAAYDALPSADKNNPDKVYYIKDAGGSGGGGGGGGSSTLSGLTDTDISSPANGQILKYNSTTQKWENAGYDDNNGVLYWDFKQSTLDMNCLSPATLTNATMGSDGVTMTSTAGYIEFQNFLLRKNMSYEVKIKSMNITDTTRHNDLFRFKNLTNNDNAGFIFRYQTQKWAVWDSVNSWQESEITDKNYFDDCTLKVKILSDGKWEIYKDGILVFAPPTALPFEGTSSWGIGSPVTNSSIQGMVIESVKIFHNS